MTSIAEHLDPTGVALPTETMIINIGPVHPAMHGTVRILAALDGERIVDADVQPGYLHRGFEKECENVTWAQVFPFTDRLNYVSPILNNVGYAMAVEKLLGLKVPERAEYIRVVAGELARVGDHLTCLAAMGMELGAMTVFLYCIRARDRIYDRLEELTGARVTHAYCRIGGVKEDTPEGWAERVLGDFDEIRGALDDVERLLLKNRIFMDRTQGVGVVSREDAISWGWTGPCGRASGVDYDVRKDHPYGVYGRLDFDVPVMDTGDCYARFYVRLVEMHQSLRIIDQALAQMQPGPVLCEEHRVVLPPKREVYNTIEGMIRHFKLIVDGIRVPAGEAYAFIEGGNGELGFYVVSDGTGLPVKVRCRPPCFIIISHMGNMIRGHSVADIVPIFGSLNMIGGECDR
ncbi:MAG: NADH-quinone oxidoreductase subunit D [Polyangia bacterium]|jgi:NADH-quinone oxidoreductase subunit D|nr:NADH-quinone oxidoreductase subunit D [Polyangia bacterium]